MSRRNVARCWLFLLGTTACTPAAEPPKPRATTAAVSPDATGAPDVPADVAPSDSASAAPTKPLLDDRDRLVVATVPTWNSSRGSLELYARQDGGWRRHAAGWPVVVGRSGVAWGMGLHPDDPPTGEPRKREGDGRAPAGAFELTMVFGYAPTAPSGTALPYIHSTATLRCVDDVKSAAYNRIIDTARVSTPFTSAERMRLKSDVYRLGVVVAHNQAARPGAGSCIFLHNWETSDTPTSGCTAMAPDKLQELAAFVTARSAFVLLPKTKYAALRATWGLP